MSDLIKVSLNFKSFEISKVVFDKPLGYSDGKFSVDLNNNHFVDDLNKNLIRSEFIISIISEDKLFNMQVQSIGHFEIEGDVSEDVYDNYIKISIPSIIYPYIRAFIGNIVLQTGMKPIIIPPINFGALKHNVSNNEEK